MVYLIFTASSSSNMMWKNRMICMERLWKAGMTICNRILAFVCNDSRKWYKILFLAFSTLKSKPRTSQVKSTCANHLNKQYGCECVCTNNKVTNYSCIALSCLHNVVTLTLTINDICSFTNKVEIKKFLVLEDVFIFFQQIWIWWESRLVSVIIIQLSDQECISLASKNIRQILFSNSTLYAIPSESVNAESCSL